MAQQLSNEEIMCGITTSLRSVLDEVGITETGFIILLVEKKGGYRVKNYMLTDLTEEQVVESMRKFIQIQSLQTEHQMGGKTNG